MLRRTWWAKGSRSLPWREVNVTPRGHHFDHKSGNASSGSHKSFQPGEGSMTPFRRSPSWLVHRRGRSRSTSSG
jgi:hypothetical protein